MTVFQSTDFDGHEQVVYCGDERSGLRAIIAIHNTNLGPALGGCRMWPYGSEREALSDALRLSRGMTYKNALAGLDCGGGKAVIIGDPKSDKSEALLRAMGRAVDSLGGHYITAEDVGMTVQDMDVLRQVTPHARGVSRGCGNPSPATAFGVYNGIRAAVAYKLKRNGLDGMRIAVQGLGSVGGRLCDYLARDGARLAVADIDEPRVRRAVETHGAEAVPSAEIHGYDADVFAPCALGAILNDETIPRIKAPIVAGAANNQLAAPRHGAALTARGILYAPDYVINAGGVIDVAAEGPGYNADAVLTRAAGIHDTLLGIFQRADAEGLPTGAIADRMAEDRFLRE